MARIRTIKPEFPHSESIGRLSRDARLLFIQLWTLVDDEGRTRAAPRMLASLLYPYDDDAPNLINAWLTELEREDLVRVYDVECSRYLEITNWLKHQKIDRPSKSRLPPFSEEIAKPREASRNLAADLGPSTKDLGPEEKPANAGHAFVGGIIRLSRKHWDDWTAAYPNLDLLAELTARDAWLGSPSATDRDRKNWFLSTATHLRNLNQRAKQELASGKTTGNVIAAADRLVERVREFNKPPPNLRSGAGAASPRLISKG